MQELVELYGCVDSVYEKPVLNYCYNVGSIKFTCSGLTCQVSGVAPHANFREEPLYNCYNLGSIIVNENGSSNDRWTHVGGVTENVQYMHNCFNAGNITFNSTYGKGTHVGSLYGVAWVEDGSQAIFRNCYWLTNTYSKAGSTQYYADPEESEIIEVDTEAELKAKALNILGTEHYKEDENNINKGWPIFKWQK